MVTNLEEALAKAKRLKDVIAAENNPYTLFYAHKDFMELDSWKKMSAISDMLRTKDTTVHDIAATIEDCQTLWKKKYVQTMEIMIDGAEKGRLEESSKESIDIMLKACPSKKQLLLDEQKNDIAHFNEMWILYDVIKRERNERASDYHKDLLIGINKRILAYLESK